MTSSLRSPRPTIFIGYSHRDRRWVDRLLVHLKPIERDMSVEIWDDSRIKPGAKWRGAIEEVLNRADAAILIISADFLASDFVMNDEVPILLQNAESNGTVIMPLIIAPSLFGQSVLNCFQAINSPENALSKLAPHKRDEILVRLAISIEAILRQIYTAELFEPTPTDRFLAQPPMAFFRAPESSLVRSAHAADRAFAVLLPGRAAVTPR